MLPFLWFLTFVPYADTCAGGSTADSQIYQNPTFTLTFNPPAAWTYPDSNAVNTLAFFPNQPLTQTQAQTNADGALQSAMLSSLSEAQINTVGIQVTDTYKPPMISDCIKVASGTQTMTMIGATIGIYEAGAITQTATVGVAIPLTPNCVSHDFATSMLTYQPFIQMATVKVTGWTGNGFQVRQVANSLMALLSFNNHVIFTQEITYM